MSQYDTRDEWGRAGGSFGPRDFRPRHPAVKLYHKQTSDDGVTLFDPNLVGAGQSAWIAAVSGVAICRTKLR